MTSNLDFNLSSFLNNLLDGSDFSADKLDRNFILKFDAEVTKISTEIISSPKIKLCDVNIINDISVFALKNNLVSDSLFRLILTFLESECFSNKEKINYINLLYEESTHHKNHLFNSKFVSVVCQIDSEIISCLNQNFLEIITDKLPSTKNILAGLEYKIDSYKFHLVHNVNSAVVSHNFNELIDYFLNPDNKKILKYEISNLSKLKSSIKILFVGTESSIARILKIITLFEDISKQNRIVNKSEVLSFNLFHTLDVNNTEKRVVFKI